MALVHALHLFFMDVSYYIFLFSFQDSFFQISPYSSLISQHVAGQESGSVEPAIDGTKTLTALNESYFLDVTFYNILQIKGL